MDQPEIQNPPLFSTENFSTDNLIRSFLLDRRSQGVSKGTLRAYTQELTYFMRFLHGRPIAGEINALTPDTIREYLADLSAHRNPGGVHIAYRVLKTFTYWWEKETDYEYRSPIRKIKPPKNPDKLMTGIPIDEFKILVNSCAGPSEKRDKAIFLFLFDTGVRATELTMINLRDIDLGNGCAAITHGKGGKQRIVFFGRATRRALRRYLRERPGGQPPDPLFVTADGERFSYNTLKMLMRRKCNAAGLSKVHYPHDFRRSFALECLRNGMNFDSIMRLMGQSSPEVLRRYINQTTNDLQNAHQRSSPADNAYFG